MREIGFPEFLFIDVIVDIDRIASGVTAEFLDEFAGHSRSAKMRGEPVGMALGRKTIFEVV